MLLDWMMKEDYIKLNERAVHCGEWRHWTYEPAHEDRKPEEVIQMFEIHIYKQNSSDFSYVFDRCFISTAVLYPRTV